MTIDLKAIFEHGDFSANDENISVQVPSSPAAYKAMVHLSNEPLVFNWDRRGTNGRDNRLEFIFQRAVLEAAAQTNPAARLLWDLSQRQPA